MDKRLIAANWKMNPLSRKDAEQLSVAIENGVKGLRGVDVLICPPFPYLIDVGSKLTVLALGSQNCFYEQKGAYTGEVSPTMLKDLGCSYVIVGHSERKKYFGETREIVNKKLKAALKAGLYAIICIGENTRDSFDSRGHWTKEPDPQIKDEILGAFLGIRKNQLNKISIAYEPVWAVGTGNAANPDDVFSVKLFIRKILSELYDRKAADSVKVLYGGSTDKKNAASFIKDGEADGLLVGGSSLDAEEFIEMVKSVSGV